MMDGDLVSKFGEYSGYTKPMYENWVQSSQYVKMEDGVKLAADIIRPAQSGEPVELPMPVVWAYYRYHRAREKEGRILSLVDRNPDLQALVKHGYVVVAVDARGTGASFGCEDKGPNSPSTTRDVYVITEWIAAQRWCDGNVGMFGHSYSANIQFLGAATSPPHLRAVFPCMAGFDLYGVMYPGGVFSEVMVRAISQGLRAWDIEMEAVPVDADTEGALARAARREHQDNADAFEFLSSYPFRNTEVDDLVFWIERNLSTRLQAVNNAGIPVYLWGGWDDFLVRGSFLWYANLTVPKKLAVGPWSHGSYDWHDLLAAEELRWFDYWL